MPRTNETTRPLHLITFGVEIECTLPETHRMRRGGYHSGRQVTGLPQGWQSQSDGSIRPTRGHYGIEIVSPILIGAAGLRQVVEVCETLKGWGVKVNKSCGLHVHIGVDPTDVRTIRNLLFTVANHETGIFASTGTKRRENGHYSSSLRDTHRNITRIRSLRDLRQSPLCDRFKSLNLTNIIQGNRPTVEFRAFAGTTNSTKIIGYIRMCLGLVHRSENKRRMTWDAKTPVESSPIHRASGDGATALNRLMYALGWTKGREKTTWGGLDGEGLPTVAECKREFQRLAKRYDLDLSEGRGRRLAG